jgi:hypothetical protein
MNKIPRRLILRYILQNTVSTEASKIPRYILLKQNTRDERQRGNNVRRLNQYDHVHHSLWQRQARLFYNIFSLAFALSEIAKRFCIEG